MPCRYCMKRNPLEALDHITELCPHVSYKQSQAASGYSSHSSGNVSGDGVKGAGASGYKGEASYKGSEAAYKGTEAAYKGESAKGYSTASAAASSHPAVIPSMSSRAAYESGNLPAGTHYSAGAAAAAAKKYGNNSFSKPDSMAFASTAYASSGYQPTSLAASSAESSFSSYHEASMRGANAAR